MEKKKKEKERGRREEGKGGKREGREGRKGGGKEGGREERERRVVVGYRYTNLSSRDSGTGIPTVLAYFISFYICRYLGMYLKHVLQI